MISKLAKDIAHFFVTQKITEESKEMIYAYGMELLLSDVLNTLIILLIAVCSSTLPAVIIFVTVFMGLRHFVGGYHANSHLSCMFTLIVVMLFFSFGICNIPEQIAQIFSVAFMSVSVSVIYWIAPVPHPNKPMSEEKMEKQKRRSRILSMIFSCVAAMLVAFRFNELSLYVSSGMLLSAVAALLGRFLNPR